MSMENISSPAESAAPACSAYATPRTRQTTAQDARRGERSCAIDRSPYSSRKTGQVRLKNSRAEAIPAPTSWFQVSGATGRADPCRIKRVWNFGLLCPRRRSFNPCFISPFLRTRLPRGQEARLRSIQTFQRSLPPQAAFLRFTIFENQLHGHRYFPMSHPESFHLQRLEIVLIRTPQTFFQLDFRRPPQRPYS